MNNNFLISIQIPTYNQKQFIKNALDSALAQTYENLQIVVSDDCSPDYNIFEYLKEYINNPKVLIHRNSVNLGRVGNYRNTLYNLVEGEWFVNLDGDDYFTSNDFINSAVDKIINEKDANISMYQGEHDLDKIKKNFKNYKFVDEDTVKVASQEFLINWYQVNKFRHSSTLFNTSLAKKVSFYNFNCIFSDFHSAAKLWSEKSNVLISNKSFSYWRKHGNNETFSLNINTCENEINATNDWSSYASKNIDYNHLRKIINFKHYHLVASSIYSLKINNERLANFFFLLRKFKFDIKYFKLLGVILFSKVQE